MALLRVQKSHTQRIVLSFLGMMKVPLYQEEQPEPGERTPTLTSQLSSVLNLGKTEIKELGKLYIDVA